jgi:hypothetical protein
MRNRITHASILPASLNNPFIRELPDEIEDEETFADRFRFRPEINEARRAAPNRQRALCLIDPLHLRVSLPRHWDLDCELSKLIRWSYTNRDPRDPRYWIEFKARMNALGNDTKDIITLPVEKHVGWGAPAVASAVQTGLMIGGTGDGKSLSVERDLQQYPQVINHGDGLNIRQVPWLKIEVTKGPRDFCITFFQALDQILGTSYYLRFRRLTEYEMLMQVVNLAFVHAIGVIVVDEFQNFGGCNIPKFLLRLNNVSKSSVLGIGTYRVEKFFDEAHELKLYRRYRQARTPDWTPLDQEKEWPIYFDELWKFQVTRKPTPPLKELSDHLFYECQGIPDFATRIYIMTQDWLIARNHSGKNAELITPGLISQIAETQLKPVRELLDAYRRRDWTFIQEFDDIRLPPLEELLAKTYGSVEVEIGPSRPADGAVEPDAEPARPPLAATRSRARRTPKCKPDGPRVPCKLVDIVGVENWSPEAAYQALKKAGLIRNPTEFWGPT